MKFVQPTARELARAAKHPRQYARTRRPGEVPPPQIDKMHGPVYMPPKTTSVRPGADDHKQIKSLGTERGSAIYHRGHQ